MSESVSKYCSIKDEFSDRKYVSQCPSHDRILNDVKELYDRNGNLNVQVKSVSSNMALLIKILAGTIVIASAMLGSIYLSVAKIDKQVATIVATVGNQEKENDRIESYFIDLQQRVLSLEIQSKQNNK